MSTLTGKRSWMGASILAAALCPSISFGAAYYMQANQSSTTFDQLSQWFDQPSGGGNNPASFDGHDFYSNGFNLRTGGGNFTFGNSSTTLTLSAGASKGLIVRAGPDNKITIPNLIADGGRIVPGVGSAHVVLNNLDLTNGELWLRPEDDGSVRTLITDIGNIFGDNTLYFGGGGNGGNIRLTIGDASNFTGSMVFSGNGVVTVDFRTDIDTPASLVLTDNARIVLNQSLTLGGLSIGDVELAPGTYSFDELNASYDTLFVDGGTGSITVVPEPTVAGLFAVVSGVLMLKRRARVA